MIEVAINILNSNYGFKLKELGADTKFSSLQEINESFDSLTRIQFVIDLEEELKICLPVNTKIDSINDINKILES